MPPTLPGLNCRLLDASNLAYAITDTGSWVDGDLSGNNALFFRKTGFIDTVFTYAAGNDDQGPKIHACLVGKTINNELILAFRGTEGVLKDWINDAQLEPTDQARIEMGGKVHSGFLNALNRLGINTSESMIVNKIKELLPSCTSFYITGHSKGGSLSYLAAKRLFTTYEITPTGVVTFAGARAGDADFAKAYGQLPFPTIRYEYGVDIVPHLPVAAPLLAKLKDIPIIGPMFNGLAGYDYESVGELRYYEAEGDDSVGESTMLEFKRRASLLGHAILDFDSIPKAHSAELGGGYMTCVCG